MNATLGDRGVLPDEVPTGVTLDRVCAGCGAEYQWTSRPGFQWPTVYCTRACKRKSSPRRRVRLESADDVPTVGMRLLICGRCGVHFGWVPRLDPTSSETPPTYHSATCANAAKVARKKRRIRDEKQARQATAEARALATQEEAHAARVAAASAAARELLLPASHCVSCGKVASPTKDAAREAKRSIEQRAGRTNAVRYYECPDGWWHWTRVDASLDGWRARNTDHPLAEEASA